MRKIKIPLVITCILLTCSFPPAAADEPDEALRPVARASMRDSDGNKTGTVMFSETGCGAVRIEVEVHSLPPGEKAMHIHEKPCGPDGFAEAGGHFNPHGKEHGFLNRKGPHAGDLPNIPVNEDGTSRAIFISNRITLKEGEKRSILRSPGTSVVIHEGPRRLLHRPGRGLRKADRVR